MSRPLTNEEKHTLTRTLALRETGEHELLVGKVYNKDGEEVGYIEPPDPVDPTPYLSQIDSLVVTSECGCGQLGCRSVFFTEKYKGKTMWKEEKPVAHGVWEGSMVIVYAHNETGELIEMEII